MVTLLSSLTLSIKHSGVTFSFLSVVYSFSFNTSLNNILLCGNLKGNLLSVSQNPDIPVPTEVSDALHFIAENMSNELVDVLLRASASSYTKSLSKAK